MVSSMDIASKYRKQLMRNHTPYEKTMKRLLKELGYKFHQQVVIPSPRSFYIVDFLIPDIPKSLTGIVIEVDGEHHAYSPAQLGWDKQRTAYLKSIGLRVIRVANRALTQYEYPKTKKWLSRSIERLRMKQTRIA